MQDKQKVKNIDNREEIKKITKKAALVMIFIAMLVITIFFATSNRQKEETTKEKTIQEEEIKQSTETTEHVEKEPLSEQMQNESQLFDKAETMVNIVVFAAVGIFVINIITKLWRNF